MPLEVKPLTREFIYNGTKLPDPNPSMGIDGVRDILAQTYPEIANAAIDGPTQKGGVQTYTIVRSVGEKG